MLDYYKGEGLDYWGSKQKITPSSVHWHKFYEIALKLRELWSLFYSASTVLHWLGGWSLETPVQSLFMKPRRE